MKPAPPRTPSAAPKLAPLDMSPGKHLEALGDARLVTRETFSLLVSNHSEGKF
jgi:hypothetical protein